MAGGTVQKGARGGGEVGGPINFKVGILHTKHARLKGLGVRV